MLGDKLRSLRLQVGLSQEALARQVDVGNQQIWRYENGTNLPSAEIVARLARALNTSADYLVGLTDDPLPHTKANDLSDKEQALIAALRRGDRLAAVRLIVSED